MSDGLSVLRFVVYFFFALIFEIVIASGIYITGVTCSTTFSDEIPALISMNQSGSVSIAVSSGIASPGASPVLLPEFGRSPPKYADTVPADATDGDSAARLPVRKTHVRRPSYMSIDIGNGVIYEGSTVGSRPEGNGVLRYPSGARYEGTVRNGAPHGHGRYIFEDADIFEGDWEEGIVRCVCGILIFANGDRFAGSFEPSSNHVPLKSGHGDLTCKSGDVFVGDIVDRRPRKGTMQYKNGARFEGLFTEHGCEGVMFYVGGAVYEGSWRRGRCHGRGVLRGADGSVVRGVWSKGKLEGPGELVDGAGTIFRGCWRDGVFEGGVSIEMADGGRREASYSNGVMHGLARFVDPEGREYQELWDNGDCRGQRELSPRPGQPGYQAPSPISSVDLSYRSPAGSSIEFSPKSRKSGAFTSRESFWHEERRDSLSRPYTASSSAKTFRVHGLHVGPAAPEEMPVDAVQKMQAKKAGPPARQAKESMISIVRRVQQLQPTTTAVRMHLRTPGGAAQKKGPDTILTGAGASGPTSAAVAASVPRASWSRSIVNRLPRILELASAAVPNTDEPAVSIPSPPSVRAGQTTHITASSVLQRRAAPQGLLQPLAHVPSHARDKMALQAVGTGIEHRTSRDSMSREISPGQRRVSESPPKRRLAPLPIDTVRRASPDPSAGKEHSVAVAVTTVVTAPRDESPNRGGASLGQPVAAKMQTSPTVPQKKVLRGGLLAPLPLSPGLVPSIFVSAGSGGPVSGVSPHLGARPEPTRRGTARSSRQPSEERGTHSVPELSLDKGSGVISLPVPLGRRTGGVSAR